MAPETNVLFITADQWRGDCLGAAAHPVVRTPNLDRLAAGGVSFRRHFAQAAPCGPSRAALYTGMYQMNNRSVLNGTPLDARHDNVALVARRLGLRAGAVRLHRHEHRPPHGARRRPAAVARTRACSPASIRCATCPRASRWRGSNGCASDGVDVPDDWRTFVDQPRRRFGSGGRSTTPRIRRRRFLTDRFIEWADASARQRLGGVVRAHLVLCGRTRRSSRPRPTTRCSIPRRCPRRCAPSPGRPRARSIRCSA